MYTNFLSNQPSESSVTQSLKTSKSLDVNTQWRLLQKRQPTVAHFITAYSYQAAPDDPAHREEISKAMLIMCGFIDSSRLREELVQRFNA